MRITRRQLRQVIREEVSRLSEQEEPGEFDVDTLLSINSQLSQLMVKLNRLGDPNVNTLSRVILRATEMLPEVATKDHVTLQAKLDILKRYIDNTAGSSR